MQSVADLVPLLFYHLWPPLATRDMAGTIVSSLCMAGATYQLLAAFREWGVPRIPRLVLAALFGLNPMVIYYGANGMSEALYLFTLVAVCRYLARWMRNDDLRSLAYAGVALGLCYLARNEAVAPAVTAGALVLAVGMHRVQGARRARIMGGLTDLTVFLFPFVMGFVGWAGVSYVITGSPFEQFTSVYGTTAQIRAGVAAGRSTWGRRSGSRERPSSTWRHCSAPLPCWRWCPRCGGGICSSWCRSPWSPPASASISSRI